MKFCRFQPLEFAAAGVARETQLIRPELRCGIVADKEVREISGDFITSPGASAHKNWSETGRSWPLDEVKLLPPTVPSKIVCLGRNYAEHAVELGHPIPKEPLIFLKVQSAIIAPDEPIVLPPISKRVDYEGEMAVVIGRPCSRLGPADAVGPYIAGYTCLNDVTARDLQNTDGQWTRAKGFDTFCPLGPVLATELDFSRATIETYLNGVRKQSAPFTEMIFSVDVIIRWISQVMTLVPGDVVSTGTPPGVGPLKVGDVVEVIVSGIGTLRNPVVSFES